MPVAFVIARMFLLKENYPCHTVRVQRCTATEHWQIYSTHYGQHTIYYLEMQKGIERWQITLWSTRFSKKQCFFSTQSQRCLTFTWIEFQIAYLLRCCLIEASSCWDIYFVFVSLFRPRPICVVSLRSSFHFHYD